MPDLKLTSIRYYSQGDERAMFEWLDRIPSVEKVWGVGRDLFVRISDADIPDEDLRELIAVVIRYGADASQLQQFESATNRHWFRDNEQAYWHESIFRRPASPPNSPETSPAKPD